MSQYFNDNGMRGSSKRPSASYRDILGHLKRFESGPQQSFETHVREAGCAASDEDIAGACSLMRRCLEFNPAHRSSALELLEDPWLREETE
jgi:serine/threonine protein kinase